MKKLNLIYITIALFFFSTNSWAQPGLPTAPSQAPIDGGLSILAAAGGMLALKKLKDRNSQQDEK